MSSSKAIIAIIVLALIAIGGYYLLNREPAAPETPATGPGYRNAVHDFSLSYPENLDILEYSPEMGSIGHLTEGGIDAVAEFRVVTIEGQPGETPGDAAARELMPLCAADGPDTTFSCTGVEEVDPFVSTPDVRGFEIYLTGDLTTISTGETTTVRKGPFFAFPLETSATATKVLIVHAPLNQSAEEADAETIRLIAETVVEN